MHLCWSLPCLVILLTRQAHLDHPDGVAHEVEAEDEDVHVLHALDGVVADNFAHELSLVEENVLTTEFPDAEGHVLDVRQGDANGFQEQIPAHQLRVQTLRVAEVVFCIG